MQIIVFGMQSSGASIVARLVNMMGAYIAPEEQEMDPQVDDPKGFWERKDVEKLNDEILQAADATWDKVSRVDFSKIDPHQ